jgi:hypothetical protein
LGNGGHAARTIRAAETRRLGIGVQDVERQQDVDRRQHENEEPKRGVPFPVPHRSS